jgi:hypothetical protein
MRSPGHRRSDETYIGGKNWNSLDPEKLRCGNASMAGDDLTIVGNYTITQYP